MKKNYLFIAGIAILCIFAVILIISYNQLGLDQGKITANKIFIKETGQGNNVSVDPADAEYAYLYNESMSIINSIDRQYKLMFTYDDLNNLKNNESYVELVFQDNQNITTGYKTITMKEATIILSGDYQGDIFTHEKDARGVGVWGSSRTTDNLNSIIEKR